ncbi:MAG: hypothetical protein ICV62_18445, partial [Cyanobacteria bacterium Co-bin13]|nr:hypothetical protein [Cyanobacteria bacterium Co-bin13]
MAMPTRLQYWLVRFKVLNRPLLWSAGLAVALLAVVANEYQRNPEWLGRFEVEGNGPNTALSNSALSPDEQAGIADVDTLSTLYSDLGLEPILPESAPSQEGAAAPQPSQNLLSILQQSAAPAASTSPEATPGAASPFASYLEQYRFLGGNNPLSPQAARPALQTVPPGFSVGAQPGLSTPSIAPAPEAAVITPLQQAVQQYSGAANPAPGSALPQSSSALV